MSVKEHSELLKCIYHVLLVINALLVFISLFRRTYQQRWSFLLYIVIVACMEVLIIPRHPNYKTFIYNTIGIGYLLLLNISLFCTVKTNTVKRIFVSSFLLFSVVAINFYSFEHIFEQFNHQAFMMLSIGLIFCALLVFIDMLLYPTTTSILKMYRFWLSVGIIIWSTFFILRIGEMFYFDKEAKEFLSRLKNVFMLINILTYTIFARALTCKTQQTR